MSVGIATFVYQFIIGITDDLGVVTTLWNIKESVG